MRPPLQGMTPECKFFLASRNIGLLLDLMATREIPGVSIERLKEDLRELSGIGRCEDGGVYRMAFTAADMAGKDWLESKMKEAGLATRRDGACNVIGRMEGRNADAPALIIGSHIDTVPCAGILDGTLGVLSGLECLRTLMESAQRPDCPLELIAFSDEEGRFGGMFGSQAFAGLITPETIHQACDLDGVKLADAMQEHGLDPWMALEAQRNPSQVSRYLELHIEQGPVLAQSHGQVGIVEAITGLFKWSVTLSGEANHAGTTPMELRRDAFMGVADFAHELPRIIDENGSEVSRATIGRVELLPGSPNTVPGEARFSIDVRDTDEEVMRELESAIRKALSAIARRRQLAFSYELDSWIHPVQCHEPLVVELEKSAKRLGVRHRRMPSGAAHDAQIVSKVCPVAMLFVPSKDGRSHSPAEWTALDDIEAGANVFLNAVHGLAFRAA